jgi:hypothetical protein
MSIINNSPRALSMLDVDRLLMNNKIASWQYMQFYRGIVELDKKFDRKVILDKAEAGHLAAVNVMALAVDTLKREGNDNSARTHVNTNSGTVRAAPRDVENNRSDANRQPLNSVSEKRVEKEKEVNLENNVEHLNMGEISQMVEMGGMDGCAYVCIDKVPYWRVDYGSVVYTDQGSDTGCCFYLSVLGKKNSLEALRLKHELAPTANKLTEILGGQKGYDRNGVWADTEVAHAYVLENRRPLYIVNESAQKTVFIRPSTKRGESIGETIYLYLSNGHYQRLYPLPTPEK